jgi:hypothetical protein
LACGAGLARATNSLGFDIYGGVGSSGWDTTGNYSFQPDPQSKPWDTSLQVSQLDSTIQTPSHARQITAGLQHALDENWALTGQATYWRDSLNDIKYVGPTLGFTYTMLDSSDSSEFLAATFTTDFFFYGTEVTSSSTTVRVGKKTTHVPPQQEAMHTYQYHPNLNIEKPLMDQSITPYLTIGHYFYTGAAPADLEDLAGRPLFSISSNRLNGLTGGFLSNNGEIGCQFRLPASFSAIARFGAQQLQTDNSWATIQGGSLSRTFGDHLKAKVEWIRTIEEGITTDLFDGGLTYYF